jgi:hypothetical protein
MATYSGFCIVDPDVSRELNEKLRSGKLGVGALEILSRPRPRRELFKNLPVGCKILGSGLPVDQPTSVEQPGVTGRQETW